MKKVTDYYLNGVFERRRTIITPETKSKEIGEIVLKPKFKDLVYNKSQEEFISLAIAQLKANKRINLLFSGYAGTGKTYSSKMIACETQRPFVYITGSMGKSKIIEMMKSLKANSIILIDEIHNLSERVAEIIYPAIEYNELYLDGNRIQLDNPCFIGTTTEPSKLPKPLLDRFMRIEFIEPEKTQIREILLKMELDSITIEKMLNYSSNIRVLKKLINLMEMYGKRNIFNLGKVFKMMRINMETGLSEEQEEYLSFLKKVGKSSLRNIGLVLRRSEEYIKMDIEPELIKKSLINVTSRGRELA